LIKGVKKMDKKGLKKMYGVAYTHKELTEKFDVLGFISPFVAVKERTTGKLGVFSFQHTPRLYFDFKPSS